MPWPLLPPSSEECRKIAERKKWWRKKSFESEKRSSAMIPHATHLASRRSSFYRVPQRGCVNSPQHPEAGSRNLGNNFLRTPKFRPTARLPGVYLCTSAFFVTYRQPVLRFPWAIEAARHTNELYVRLLMTKGCKKEQVGQCLGFCPARNSSFLFPVGLHISYTKTLTLHNLFLFAPLGIMQGPFKPNIEILIPQFPVNSV